MTEEEKEHTAVPVRRAMPQPPEPARLWIGWAPRSWRCRSRQWLDIGRGRFGAVVRGRLSEVPETIEPESIDDRLYLPPVEPDLRSARDELAASLYESGTPILVQVAPGEEPPSCCGASAWDASEVEARERRVEAAAALRTQRIRAAEEDGERLVDPDAPPPEPEVPRPTVDFGLRPVDVPPDAMAVCDLTGILLAGEPERVTEVPRGSLVVWPLIAGVTDHPGLWEESFEVFEMLGVRGVHGVAPELDGNERRRMAEGRGDDVFDALFHGSAPSERAFHRAVARAGLVAFPERPRTGVSQRLQVNRAIAATLALAGDLWLRLDLGLIQGQSLLRAARGAEMTHRDIVAIARDENLKVLDWLDPESTRIVEEWVDFGYSPRIEALRGFYLGQDHETDDLPDFG